MNGYLSTIFLCIFASQFSYFAYSETLSYQERVTIKVNVIGEPCDVDLDSENITVDFGTIVDKYLYINTKSHIEPFTINLINCDVEDGEGVKVSFVGQENMNLPGMLAVDSGSMASNIGIAILDKNNLLIPINSETSIYMLKNGDNSFPFKGYVQAEPDAIKNKNIELGSFTATASFILNYN
ncbi:type 1 fimbrial protein [Providencia stuartii]|uniref:fimbrial protein n=1 Tax=Providencia stuartii TaxID=588 RepID=UPI000D9A05AF|nr:fimbrial protein [Providencia stuartii]MBG5898547.1 type 1 fimbrial protein [Providencia stuartii]MTC65607.1 fimbrial protein [Providencia stuartii]SPY69302.1 Fimbrial adapter papK precursor [Providencia stuartii]